VKGAPPRPAGEGAIREHAREHAVRRLDTAGQRGGIARAQPRINELDEGRLDGRGVRPLRFARSADTACRIGLAGEQRPVHGQRNRGDELHFAR
jgi:hypothetical protein